MASTDTGASTTVVVPIAPCCATLGTFGVGALRPNLPG